MRWHGWVCVSCLESKFVKFTKSPCDLQLGLPFLVDLHISAWLKLVFWCDVADCAVQALIIVVVDVVLDMPAGMFLIGEPFRLR